ncbi:MAG: MBL fold metallo-hydrolase [Promethearchaeota archaeon]|jgi:L-ascorbate metabolism protein UlaG (beta-lactamase superfamily)
MKLKWLLTAAFEVYSESFKILFDPWISRPKDATPQLVTNIRDIKNYDAIFLSHGHYDHSADIPEIVKGTETKVYCSPQVGELFIKDFGVNKQNIVKIQPAQTIEFQPEFRVTTIRSQHIQFDEPILKLFELLKSTNQSDTKIKTEKSPEFILGDVFGFLMEFSNGKKLVHFGSGGYYEEELKNLPSNIDIFLAPVAGRTDVDKVIAEMANIFKPKMIIPHHYDNFLPPVTIGSSYLNLVEEVKKINPSIVVNILEHETYYEF